MLLWSFLATVLVAIVNFLAATFYLYWSYWWFDNVTHFLGGLAIGLFGIAILKYFYNLSQSKFKNILLITALIVLVVGIGWEIFEFYTGTTNPSAGETYLGDTMGDLLADLLGAFSASLIIYKGKLNV